MHKLNMKDGPVKSHVGSVTQDVLSYVKQRNTLWIKQDAKKDRKNGDSLELDRNHLPYLDEEG